MATISLSDRPGGIGGQPDSAPLFGLAPGGVCPATTSQSCWWALTPPFHPYRRETQTPQRLAAEATVPLRPTAVWFLWHFPKLPQR